MLLVGPGDDPGKEIGKKTNNRMRLPDSVQRAIVISLSGPEKEFRVSAVL